MLHLRDTLQRDYKITEDWDGANYCGLDLDWHYDEGYVDIKMKGYIKKTLQRFEHSPPAIENTPSQWTPPDYGAKQQYSEDPDLTPPLDKQDVKRLQAIIGTLLYYARAVDSTMLVALGTLAASQTNGTQATLDAAIKLLNYAALHPDAKV